MPISQNCNRHYQYRLHLHNFLALRISPKLDVYVTLRDVAMCVAKY